MAVEVRKEECTPSSMLLNHLLSTERSHGHQEIFTTLEKAVVQ